MSHPAPRRLLRSASARDVRRSIPRELYEAPLGGARFLARAWAAIFAVEASLNTIGYKRTLRWIEAVPASRSRRRGTPVDLGEKLVRAAYRAHVFGGGCLPRSLVQYLLHRRDGTAARFVVGVRRATSDDRSPESAAANEGSGRGIEAHAWVEPPEAQGPASTSFAPIFETGARRWSPARASAKEK